MISYTIKEPIWGSKSVGIATHRVKGDTMVEIRISYKDSGGNLVFPFSYFMHSSRIRRYPTKMSGTIPVHIVPIDDFEAR
jgi:hypothetical protein